MLKFKMSHASCLFERQQVGYERIQFLLAKLILQVGRHKTLGKSIHSISNGVFDGVADISGCIHPLDSRAAMGGDTSQRWTYDDSLTTRPVAGGAIGLEHGPPLGFQGRER